ncbi:magnesium transporter [Aureimonas jatrophae]|uniref:Magnesium transporter MgtE n=1 Tax=Aureimonas jatrophae TaxID=1166073 RepID=A0A1H0GW11_9HYPH|nr:magnesium transporter [Aureimonas jatrophae]
MSEPVQAVAERDVLDEDDGISPHLLGSVRAALAAEDRDRLLRELSDLHQSELGRLLERLTPFERTALVDFVGADFDYSALTEVDEAIRLDILQTLSSERVAQALGTLESDDAVYILEDLPEDTRNAVLEHIPFAERLRLRRALEYPAETAGRRMQTEYVAAPPYWSVAQTLDYLRSDPNLPDRFSEIFVVDPRFRLMGSVALPNLLRASTRTLIETFVDPDPQAIAAEMDQEEAARLFERYDLLSAAVVDEDGRLVGVLTIDDIVDVIQSEADEDIRLLGGVGDEELSDTVAQITRSRFSWLLINLATAILASLVIDMFDATIQQMVALAVLMPIVASMGGNAGTQTMTVAVRALATRDLTIHNAWRVVRRETTVSCLNGALFAVLIGLVASVWFSSTALGLVIAAAMIINMLAAGLAGILIPLLIDRAGADPAIASGTFVTTVTDVVGFFAFLGLATLFFT